ncbi:OmpA family protein [Pedobacter glucosidilyticus]|uniref:OmpA family protein n=1 Tax=Pedobacter glucosidilyticus TaxID=1122941 RepID=UPI00041544CB|nr:OmpA family protein [Pedobacter glucosidilyticus]
MRILFILSSFIIINLFAHAQESLKDKLKRKLAEAKERTTDQTIDKIIGKGEQKVDQEIDEAIDGKPKSTKKSTATTENDVQKTAETAANASTMKLSASSKFDFISGEKIIGFEDFKEDAIGDFPAKWNTNSSGELVSVTAGTGKWLKFGQKGIFYPEYINALPENFTIEFDMLVSDDLSAMQSGLKVIFPSLQDRNLTFDQYFTDKVSVSLDIHPDQSNAGTSNIFVIDNNGQNILNNDAKFAYLSSKVNRVSIWRQKSRLRVYINESKVWDLPRAFIPNINYSILFATNIFEGAAFLNNLKVAVGAPDTRNKLITDGKLVTRGILFDVNSAQIRPESGGILKEIANVLQENPTVKIKIVGHTDNDGVATANLELSKKRAEAVKTTLSSIYNIEANRMQTDGKGAAEPSEPNTSTQAKANNRRVEFIKL